MNGGRPEIMAVDLDSIASPSNGSETNAATVLAVALAWILYRAEVSCSISESLGTFVTEICLEQILEPSFILPSSEYCNWHAKLRLDDRHYRLDQPFIYPRTRFVVDCKTASQAPDRLDLSIKARIYDEWRKNLHRYFIHSCSLMLDLWESFVLKFSVVRSQSQ